MRPLRLVMKNFMSYEMEEIDFSSISIAAIVGPNGSGKSTILQAMTYALWGETRAASHNDVVRHGTATCVVLLEFAANGGHYRVVRRRHLGKSSDLELSLLDGEYEIPMTKGTIKETQGEINRIIKVSYNVFASSSLLQQGESSRFSNSPPGKRKELLGELIGLDELRHVEAVARQRARDNRIDLDKVDAQLFALDDALHEVEETATNPDELAEELAEIEELAATTEKLLSNVSADLRDAEMLGERYTAAVDLHNSLTEQENVLLHNNRKLAQDEADAKVLTRQARRIRERASQKKRLEQEKPDLREVRDVYLEMQHLADLHEDLDARQKELRESEVEKASISGYISGLQDAMDAVEEEIDAIRIEAAEINALIMEQKRLKQQLESSVTCPTCGGLMNNRSRVIDSAVAKIDALSSKGSDMTSRLSTLLESSAELEQDIKEAREEMLDLADRMSANRTLLAETIMEIDGRKVEEVFYQDGEYEELLEMLEKLKGADVDLVKLEAAEEKLKSAKAQLDHNIEILSSLRREISEQKGAADLLDEEMARSNGVEYYTERVKALTADLFALRERYNNVNSAIAVNDNAIRRRDRMLAQYDELKAESDRLLEMDRTLGELIKASSKTGAQALLIEAALPQIETDTNNFLDMISPGMAIALESQKVTTTGNVSETLDIKVTMDGEVRPIETLSGGERFRADLALRLAIGSLPARRSDAKIDMLAIDEGFGTQDEEGIASITETILGLTTVFPLILIITHVRSIAENVGEYGKIVWTGG